MIVLTVIHELVVRRRLKCEDVRLLLLPTLLISLKNNSVIAAYNI